VRSRGQGRGQGKGQGTRGTGGQGDRGTEGQRDRGQRDRDRDQAPDEEHSGGNGGSWVGVDGGRTLSAIAEFDIGGGVDGAYVFGAGADEAVVVELLDDVGCPAGDTAYGKDRGVEIDVDAEGGVG
jgi:hypothetical protein